jgi:hypothetical protein
MLGIRALDNTGRRDISFAEGATRVDYLPDSWVFIVPGQALRRRVKRVRSTSNIEKAKKVYIGDAIAFFLEIL